ncbi:mechanosensitive ion channel domain-containing protein [Pseudofulvibacter geojedonensis]|uniref:Mechanosensitive ion channel domain-containing protein n=1 Tax=Pseudofulvibacter geojedonensis TaxID=1123758 RepID=A0ABW3I1M3_9FLAO
MKYNLIFNTIISGIIVITLILSIQFIKSGVKKFSISKGIDKNRRKVILNASYLCIYLLSGVLLALTWGIKFNEFSLFISSILAVLGVGFFAQWSLLSNLTSSVILFFYHPMRIGDKIKIIDKDYNWTGTVVDITGFYVFLRTDLGENITIPTSLVLQRGIEILKE